MNAKNAGKTNGADEASSKALTLSDASGAASETYGIPNIPSDL
jgi:hypothetical protein